MQQAESCRRQLHHPEKLTGAPRRGRTPNLPDAANYEAERERAEISKAITTAKLIGLSPWAKATTLARKGYLSGQCQVERLAAGFLSSVT